MSSYLRQKFQSFHVGTSLPSHPEDVKEEALSSENRDEIERSKVGIMRVLIQTQDPSAKDLDYLMMHRFLRARDLDVEKASDMLLKFLKWRKQFVPNGFISPADIPNNLAHNKLCMQGYDKTGRPIVVVFASRHKPTTVEEFKHMQ
jgi:hypothetical protein